MEEFHLHAIITIVDKSIWTEIKLAQMDIICIRMNGQHTYTCLMLWIEWNPHRDFTYTFYGNDELEAKSQWIHSRLVVKWARAKRTEDARRKGWERETIATITTQKTYHKWATKCTVYTLSIDPISHIMDSWHSMISLYCGSRYKSPYQRTHSPLQILSGDLSTKTFSNISI